MAHERQARIVTWTTGVDHEGYACTLLYDSWGELGIHDTWALHDPDIAGAFTASDHMAPTKRTPGDVASPFGDLRGVKRATAYMKESALWGQR